MGSPVWKSKIEKISEQNWLEGLQMVQFECPRRWNPWVPFRLGDILFLILWALLKGFENFQLQHAYNLGPLLGPHQNKVPKLKAYTGATIICDLWVTWPRFWCVDLAWALVWASDSPRSPLPPPPCLANPRRHPLKKARISSKTTAGQRHGRSRPMISGSGTWQDCSTLYN